MKYIIIILLSALAFQACNPEYKLARKYIDMRVKPTVVVIPPSFIYKNNMDPHDTIGLSALDTLSRDSVIYTRSTYLQWIDDTTFTRIFTNSFMNELQLYGLNVKLADSSVTESEGTWKVNFIQLQLEENQQLIPESDYVANFGAGRDDQSPNNRYDHFLNSITCNTWLKVHSLGRKTDSATLFHYDVETDHLEQGFSLQSYLGKPVLIPKNKLQLSDIYLFAKEQGSLEAELFYDLMLNSYLYFNISNPSYYYEYVHYDRISRKLYPANDFKFEVIKE